MTYAARTCPCCNSTRLDAYPALVSRFLASYVFEGTPGPTRLLQCERCGFRFFEDRLTDGEADRLYSGYRGDRYFRERNRCEPWYTRKVNEALGGSEDVTRARRDLVDGFLRRNVDVAKLDDVLDFGGDKGQMIPDGIGKHRFVYEISGTHPVHGVTRIGRTDELAEKRFDLVLLCHVLEHCSEPKAVLDQVRPLLRSKDSLVYVELPFEYVDLRWLGKSRAYGVYLGALRRLPPLLTAVDLYSTLVRTRLETMPPLGFVKMHEHINFFAEDSLRHLLARTGLDLVSIERLVVRSTLGETPVLSALARPA